MTSKSSFEELCLLPDESIDVVRGAAFIAKDRYATVNVDGLVDQVRALSKPLVALGLSALSAETQARAVSRHLYEVHGFRGNEGDYYDPRNSLLPDVLERRMGIPISLAIVYCDVAQMAGVRASGVSFPGHFLVRIDASDGDVAFVDPFSSGNSLDREGLVRLLRRASGPTQELRDEHLVAASPRAILVRMLINLKWVYTTRGDLARALLALDRIVCLMPDAPAALRERGTLAAKLGAVETARADFTRLLELSPDVADATSLRARLDELKGSRAVLN